ncbi:MAG TPA: FAD-dependent oxidoreductase [Pyrinomonadaceae bacterium]|nr:FAD-dependent oxidoreductase [Pyrinomonadaceae bacterium]
MARILIAGGGFGGVVAAEALVKQIRAEHDITLVSRNRNFVFYPDLVRLAFGKCEPDDISIDLRETMLSHRVRFVQGDVARLNPEARTVTVSQGELEGKLSYDYLILALGRRLATERVTGFFEHAGHILDVPSALKFGEQVKSFKGGRIVVGQCPGARLPVPVFETAFAFSRLLKQKGQRDAARITIVNPDPPNLAFSDLDMARALRDALEEHSIESLSDFPIDRVLPTLVMTPNGHCLDYQLLMLIPPFRGPGAVMGLGITGEEGYITVDRTMRVQGIQNVYAVGDCVDFVGPKLGHMAVHQAEVAAANLALELQEKDPNVLYDHEMMMVIDEGGDESIYLRKGLWDEKRSVVKQGRFWSWAKWIHEKYWLATHS